MIRLSAVLALVWACVGCSSPSYYDWGRYEESVYVVTATPDGFDLQAEIDALELQLEQTRNKQRPVPPGFHAHLGYLHTVAGNPAAARQHFQDEQALFPESTRFMGYLLSRLDAGT